MSHKRDRPEESEGGSLENEACFRIFFERSADAMSLFDPSTLEYIEANEAAAKLLGAGTRETLRGASPLERWPERQPDGRLSVEKAQEMMRIALDNGSHRFEFLVRRYDGSELPLDIVMTAVPFGERTVLSLVYRDISSLYQRAEADLRKSEARLRESEERFRTAFRVSPLNITILRLSDAKFVEANDEFVRWLGIDRERLIGRDSRELGIWLNLEDREKFLTELRQKGSLRNVECRLRSRRGTVHTLLQSAEVIEIDREPHMLVVGLDITQRKEAEAELRESEAKLRESEERFSKAFRANPVHLSIMRTSDRKFIEVNDALVQWLGLDRDKIIGRDSMELNMWVNLDDRVKFWADLERSHGSLREIEVQARSQRGTVHTLLLSAESIEINREPHLLIFALDITQRKQAEAELLRTLAREKELGLLRSKFVSMVSHEFRTPLGIIQSSAEILEDYMDRLEPFELQENLQSIHNNTRRMAAIMEEALFIGSFDAGKIEAKLAPVKLERFLGTLVEEIASTTGERCPIKLSLYQTPEEIHADERLLGHIFTNLLTNAIKYSATGSPVRFEAAGAGDHVAFVVRDCGIGIPETDREWLFNAFHRGHNVDDRPGTGLGLVIVKRCVDLVGGEIKVDSRLGEGTTVTVRLPLLRQANGTKVPV